MSSQSLSTKVWANPHVVQRLNVDPFMVFSSGYALSARTEGPTGLDGSQSPELSHGRRPSTATLCDRHRWVQGAVRRPGSGTAQGRSGGLVGSLLIDQKNHIEHHDMGTAA